jgi:hypothetical protein
MAKRAVVALMAAAVTVGGCDSSGTFRRVPTAPTASPPSSPPAPTPPVVRSGSVFLKTTTPPSGATVPVRDCVAAESSRPCTDQVQLAFDIVLNQPMRSPILYVEFRDSDTRCAWTASGFEGTVAAETVLSLSTAVTYFWFPNGSSQTQSPCGFPAATSRIFVNLWSDADGEYLTRDFDLSYTFARH